MKMIILFCSLSFFIACFSGCATDPMKKIGDNIAWYVADTDECEIKDIKRDTY